MFKRSSTMTAERWQGVERLFHQALERPINEQAAFVHESSAGDEALSGEVQSLLREHYLANTFLEVPLVQRFASRRAAPFVTLRTSRIRR